MERKLEAVRRAMEYNGPVADIDEMLAEMEQAYLDEFRNLGDLPE